jgi:hypothetical protein
MSASSKCEHGKRILVSPIGMSPGALFSAVQACRAEGSMGEPTLCIVICSEESEKKIDEALQKAKYRGEVKRLTLENPYGGLPEIERLVRDGQESLKGAEQVVVNITGGTTLMGLTAEKLAATAQRTSCEVRRLGLIDSRQPEQQRSDPYQEGEPLWLD